VIFAFVVVTTVLLLALVVAASFFSAVAGSDSQARARSVGDIGAAAQRRADNIVAQTMSDVRRAALEARRQAYRQPRS
jgi:hypothetical protein